MSKVTEEGLREVRVNYKDCVRERQNAYDELRLAEKEMVVAITSDCTAMIANPTGLINVSGTKVIRIYNGTKNDIPLKDGAIIEGQNSWLELKTWQLTTWGRSVFENVTE